MFPPTNTLSAMEYWTIIDDRHAGPFSARQLIEMGIKADSPVWTSGLPDWVEAAQIEELKQMLEAPATVTDEQGCVDAKPESTMPKETQPTESPIAAATEQPTPGNGSGNGMPASQQTVAPAPTPAPAPAPAMQSPVYQQPAEPRWEWQQPPVQPSEPCPPAYLPWSIIVTILCCQPLGIAAIICSAMTKQAYNRGNMQKATKMSDAAQWLIILSIVFGLISLPLQLAML